MRHLFKTWSDQYNYCEVFSHSLKHKGSGTILKKMCLLTFFPARPNLVLWMHAWIINPNVNIFQNSKLWDTSWHHLSFWKFFVVSWDTKPKLTPWTPERKRDACSWRLDCPIILGYGIFWKYFSNELIHWYCSIEAWK